MSGERKPCGRAEEEKYFAPPIEAAEKEKNERHPKRKKV